MEQSESIWTSAVNSEAMKAAGWAIRANGYPRGAAFHRDDVAQETLVEFWKACEEDGRPTPLCDLMYTIADRIVIREIRKARVRQRALPGLLARSGEWVRFPQPEEAATRNEELAQQAKLFKLLPGRLDNTQLLVYGFRLRNPNQKRAEICRVLGISLDMYKRALRGIPEVAADLRERVSRRSSRWMPVIRAEFSGVAHLKPDVPERLIAQVPVEWHGLSWMLVANELLRVCWDEPPEIDHGRVRWALRYAVNRMNECLDNLGSVRYLWLADRAIGNHPRATIDRIVDTVERTYTKDLESTAAWNRRWELVRRFGLNDVLGHPQVFERTWRWLEDHVTEFTINCPLNPSGPIIRRELHRLFVGLEFGDGISWTDRENPCVCLNETGLTSDAS